MHCYRPVKPSVQLGIVQLSTLDAENAKNAKDEFEGEVGGQFPRKGFLDPHPPSSKWDKTLQCNITQY